MKKTLENISSEVTSRESDYEKWQDFVAEQLPALPERLSLSTVEEATRVAEVILRGHALRDKIDAFWTPLIEQAHKAWKKLCDIRRELYQLLDKVDGKARPCLAEWLDAHRADATDIDIFKSFSVRPQIECELVDKKKFLRAALDEKIPLEWVTWDEKLVKQIARAASGEIRIPGVAIKKKRALVVHGENK